MAIPLSNANPARHHHATPRVRRGAYSALKKSTISETTEHNTQERAAGENHLLYARPNPFQDTTTVVIRTAEQARVALRVFNSRGQLVRVLFEGTMDAGEHSFSFERASLPDGFYLCTLLDGRIVETRRLLLMR